MKSFPLFPAPDDGLPVNASAAGGRSAATRDDNAREAQVATPRLSRFGVFLAGAALAVGAVWFIDVRLDRMCGVDIGEPARLYMMGPHDYPKGNVEIATLPAGERARVMRVRYGKDFQSVQVQTEGGLKGWILGGGAVKLTGCLQ